MLLLLLPFTSMQVIHLTILARDHSLVSCETLAVVTDNYFG